MNVSDGREAITVGGLRSTIAHCLGFGFLLIGYGCVGLVQQVDDGLIEVVAGLEAIAGADDVADDNVDAGGGGAHVD